MNNNQNNVNYVKIFNQLVDEFFRELIEMFPNQTKIRVNYNLFQTICKANMRKPCNDFMFGSVPYLEKICMKDETFFTGKDKPSLLSSMNIENWWTPELSENTKDTIWKYIQSFFTIGIKIVDMPPDSQEMIKYIIEN
jgi:hypothetical protein